MSDTKPKIIVFDLDYTLWPFWVDTHVTPPFKIRSNHKVVDANGQEVQPYKDSSEVLANLHKEGYKIGIASRTGEIQGANQLIELFGWKGLIHYKEIYPGCKITHFKKIHNDSGIKYEDMIFFDDEQRNIQDLKQLGVFSVLVKNGVNKLLVNEALEHFAKQR